jgi:hypothetical protein
MLGPIKSILGFSNKQTTKDSKAEEVHERWAPPSVDECGWIPTRAPIILVDDNLKELIRIDDQTEISKTLSNNEQLRRLYTTNSGIVGETYPSYGMVMLSKLKGDHLTYYKEGKKVTEYKPFFKSGLDSPKEAEKKEVPNLSHSMIHPKDFEIESVYETEDGNRLVKYNGFLLHISGDKEITYINMPTRKITKLEVDKPVDMNLISWGYTNIKVRKISVGDLNGIENGIYHKFIHDYTNKYIRRFPNGLANGDVHFLKDGSAVMRAFDRFYMIKEGSKGIKFCPPNSDQSPHTDLVTGQSIFSNSKVDVLTCYPLSSDEESVYLSEHSLKRLDIARERLKDDPDLVIEKYLNELNKNSVYRLTDESNSSCCYVVRLDDDLTVIGSSSGNPVLTLGGRSIVDKESVSVWWFNCKKYKSVFIPESQYQNYLAISEIRFLEELKSGKTDQTYSMIHPKDFENGSVYETASGNRLMKHNGFLLHIKEPKRYASLIKYTNKPTGESKELVVDMPVDMNLMDIPEFKCRKIATPRSYANLDAAEKEMVNDFTTEYASKHIQRIPGFLKNGVVFCLRDGSTVVRVYDRFKMINKGSKGIKFGPRNSKNPDIDLGTGESILVSASVSPFYCYPLSSDEESVYLSEESREWLEKFRDPDPRLRPNEVVDLYETWVELDSPEQMEDGKIYQFLLPNRIDGTYIGPETSGDEPVIRIKLGRHVHTFKIWKGVSRYIQGSPISHSKMHGNIRCKELDYAELNNKLKNAYDDLIKEECVHCADLQEDIYYKAISTYCQTVRPDMYFYGNKLLIWEKLIGGKSECRTQDISNPKAYAEYAIKLNTSDDTVPKEIIEAAESVGMKYDIFPRSFEDMMVYRAHSDSNPKGHGRGRVKIGEHVFVISLDNWEYSNSSFKKFLQINHDINYRRVPTSELKGRVRKEYMRILLMAPSEIRGSSDGIEGSGKTKREVLSAFRDYMNEDSVSVENYVEGRIYKSESDHIMLKIKDDVFKYNIHNNETDIVSFREHDNINGLLCFKEIHFDELRGKQKNWYLRTLRVHNADTDQLTDEVKNELKSYQERFKLHRNDMIGHRFYEVKGKNELHFMIGHHHYKIENWSVNESKNYADPCVKISEICNEDRFAEYFDKNEHLMSRVKMHTSLLYPKKYNEILAGNFYKTDSIWTDHVLCKLGDRYYHISLSSERFSSDSDKSKIFGDSSDKFCQVNYIDLTPFAKDVIQGALKKCCVTRVVAVKDTESIYINMEESELQRNFNPVYRNVYIFSMDGKGYSTCYTTNKHVFNFQYYTSPLKNFPSSANKCYMKVDRSEVCKHCLERFDDMVKYYRDYNILTSEFSINTYYENKFGNLDSDTSEYAYRHGNKIYRIHNNRTVRENDYNPNSPHINDEGFFKEADPPSHIKDAIKKEAYKEYTIKPSDYELGVVYQPRCGHYYRFIGKDGKIYSYLEDGGDPVVTFSNKPNEYTFNERDLAKVIPLGEIPKELKDIRESHIFTVKGMEVDLYKIYKCIGGHDSSDSVYVKKVDSDTLHTYNIDTGDCMEVSVGRHNQNPIYMYDPNPPSVVVDSLWELREKLNMLEQFSPGKFEEGKYYKHKGYYEGFILSKREGKIWNLNLNRFYEFEDESDRVQFIQDIEYNDFEEESIQEVCRQCENYNETSNNFVEVTDLNTYIAEAFDEHIAEVFDNKMLVGMKTTGAPSDGDSWQELKNRVEYLQKQLDLYRTHISDSRLHRLRKEESSGGEDNAVELKPQDFGSGTIIVGDNGTVFYRKDKDTLCDLNSNCQYTCEVDDEWAENYIAIGAMHLTEKQRAAYEKHAS